ncbi:MAG: TonB-dependent receptor [Ectothiorhodospiraceae bacterium]|nr:TonB-dependent receptor [Ectothiorhodospiraceae bacterium]
MNGLTAYRRVTLVGLAGLAIASPAQGLASENALQRIVVTASGFEQDVREAPASISVISREELEQKRFSNIAEALADIPGVDVRTGTGKTGGLNVSIRGMPSDYTLILIDGRRQNTAGNVTPNGFGETATSFMPPLSAIERIEVIRGPMSTRYGSDALGGVINIITRPVGERWGGTLTVDNTIQQHRDAANSSTVSLFTTGPLVEDTLGLQLRGRVFDRGESDRLIEGSTGRDPRPVEARIYSLGARLSWTPNRDHTLWLDAERARQVYDNSDGRLGTLDTPDRAFGYRDELRFNRDQLAAGHTSHVGIATVESSVTRNVTETLGRTLPAGSAPGYGYEAAGGEPRLLENRELVLDSRVTLPAGRHILSLGGQYTDAELEDGAAGNQSFEQSSWALFLEDEWWLTDDLALTLGGRYERHDAFGGHVSPRAYLVWNSTDTWTLKGGVARGYKTPTLNQLHDGITGFAGQGRTVMIGSPHLEPEKSTNYELGALYDNHRGLSAGITLFHTRFTDRIANGQPIPNCQHPDGNVPGCISIGDFTEQADFHQLVNVDRAESSGVELIGAWRFAPAWQVSGSYTYTETEITSGDSEGLLLTNTPKHVLNARLSWNLTPRLSTWIEGEYYGSRERFPWGKPTSGQNRALYEQAGNKLESYELFHLGARYILAENVRLTATVYNLLDKDFGRADSYQWDGETHQAYRYTQTGMLTDGVYLDRRHLWLSATYEF